MERAGIAGDLLPWRDALHEGPVPDLPPDELRRVRAEYWGTGEAQFRERDERLSAAIETLEPVVLWFEHDLYDQLQLIQILAGLPDRPEHAELICVGTFPGRPGFAGLGELEPDELASLWPVRTAITPEHVHLARAAWDVVRGEDPRALARAAATPDERLPYLAPALRRLLEELPGTRDGLGAHGAPAARGGRRRRAHAGRRVPREHGRRGGAVHGRHVRLRPPRRARTRSSATTAACSSPRTAGRCWRAKPIGWTSSASTAGSAACTSAPRARCGAGTTCEASSANPDPLASKACPVPPRSAQRSRMRSPSGPSASSCGTAPSCPPPARLVGPPSPPARRRRSRTSCAPPASSASAAPT